MPYFYAATDRAAPGVEKGYTYRRSTTLCASLGKTDVIFFLDWVYDHPGIPVVSGMGSSFLSRTHLLGRDRPFLALPTGIILFADSIGSGLSGSAIPVSALRIQIFKGFFGSSFPSWGYRSVPPVDPGVFRIMSSLSFPPVGRNGPVQGTARRGIPAFFRQVLSSEQLFSGSDPTRLDRQSSCWLRTCDELPVGQEMPRARQKLGRGRPREVQQDIQA